MTIQNLYPNIDPTLLLDFANVKALDPRITFVRTTTAVYYGTDSAKAEENLVLQSQDFTTSWGLGNVTIGTNAATAPDGTATAETLDDDSATGTHTLFLAATTTASLTHVASVFFKNVDRQFVTIAVSSGTNAWAAAKFDLAAGTLGSTSQAGSGWSATSSSITNVGNSWYRCSLVFVPGNGLTTFRIGLATDGTTFTAGERGLESYTGSDKVVEVWGCQLEQRSAVTSYTPTTTQPVTNYIPVLETAAAGEARFDHNPLTFESLGLLIEEQRTNLLFPSENFNIGNTTKSTGFSFGIQMQQYIENAGVLNRFTSESSITGTVTQTVYAKALPFGSQRFVQMRSTSPVAGVVFNVNNGSISNKSADNLVTASITLVGNGVYRCSATFISASSSVLVIGLQSSSSNLTGGAYTGDAVSGLFLGGRQLEAGAFPTSYIQTVAATVTRNADNASMTGTNFSSWYRADQGTLYGEYAKGNNATSGRLATISNGTDANQIRVGISVSTGPRPDMQVVTNSNVEANVLGPDTTVNTFVKIAGVYKVNDVQSAVNGTARTADTSAIIPVVNQMQIGANHTTLGALNGTIKKLSFYPARLSNAQLQALTTV